MKTNKAMIYAIFPSIIIWSIIMTPMVLLYTIYIEPKEIAGNLILPEWTVMPSALLIIGLLVYIWKVLTYKISSKLKASLGEIE